MTKKMGVFGFDHKKRESLVKKKGEIGQKKNKRREREDNFYMLVKEEGRKKIFLSVWFVTKVERK